MIRSGDAPIPATSLQGTSCARSNIPAGSRRKAGRLRAILKSLAGGLPDIDAAITLRVEGALRYAYPQRLLPNDGPITIFARAARAHTGVLRLRADGETLAIRRISALPERRLALTFPGERLRGQRDAVVTLD